MYVLRNDLNLYAAKYGCGFGQCGACTVMIDGVATRSWADYPILTYAEVPRVKVSLINLPDAPSLGAGEGAQGPTVGAIANAFARATGKRMRDLPFTPDKVKALLA